MHQSRIMVNKKLSFKKKKNRRPFEHMQNESASFKIK